MILSMLGTMGGSFVLSAVTALWAQSREDKHQEHLITMEALAGKELSRNAADSRGGGQKMRRAIALAMVFYFFGGPLILYAITLFVMGGDVETADGVKETVTNFNQHYQTSYANMKERGGIIGFVFGKNPRLEVDTFGGLPMLPETLHAFSAMIGFYFGGDATKR